MTATLERPVAKAQANGGSPARRAVIRWAWRMFRREWRQQLLILILIAFAVAATIVGSAVATDSPPPANAGFGTAQYAAQLSGSDPQLSSVVADLRQRFGSVDVIENQALPVPGSVETYTLRAQDPHGPFGTPMLSLVSGAYPSGSGEVALTEHLATTLGLHVGDEWQSRRVVGLVSNPQSLLDDFALVAPGQVTAPTQVTVLFDGPDARPSDLGPNVTSPSQQQQGAISPATVVLAVATVFLLLIGLVSVSGFTVLAQRRLRSIGMLGAVGATDKNLRLVVRANGVIVGVVGTAVGALLGLAAWFAYRPSLQDSVHHVIGVFQLPWIVIGPGMALAVITAYLAASRPARSITRVPIVTALSGRPATPAPLHRSVLPGLILLVVAFLLLGTAGRSNGNGGGSLALVGGFIALIVAVVFLAPLTITALGRVSRRASIGVRLAIGDLARYRSRASASLAAISVALFIAVFVCVATAARYGDPLDYVGPNLSSTQAVVHVAAGQGCDPQCHPPSAQEFSHLQEQATAIAALFGSTDIVELDGTSATLQHAAVGRNYSGPLYVATPQLLQAMGIDAGAIKPGTDIATMRPGLATTSKLQVVYGHYFDEPPTAEFACPHSDCLAGPAMQELTALPPGTSAPNTVITEKAVRQLGLDVVPQGWLIQTAHALTDKQISSARLLAAESGLALETKSQAPTSAQVLNWATGAGIVLALGILAMTVGLLRAETARDRGTLVATGASTRTQRTITAATAGGLAVLGALLGTLAGYLAAIGYFHSYGSGDSLASLRAVPLLNLALIVVGLPVIATVGGWLLSGRRPTSMSHQPID